MEEFVKKEIENITKVALEHWAYIENLLKNHEEENDIIKKVKFHYISAFVHGAAHQYEKDHNDIKISEFVFPKTTPIVNYERIL